MKLKGCSRTALALTAFASMALSAQGATILTHWYADATSPHDATGNDGGTDITATLSGLTLSAKDTSSGSYWDGLVPSAANGGFADNLHGSAQTSVVNPAFSISFDQTVGGPAFILEKRSTPGTIDLSNASSTVSINGGTPVAVSTYASVLNGDLNLDTKLERAFLDFTSAGAITSLDFSLVGESVEFKISDIRVAAIPEPSGVVLLGFTGIAALLRRRR